MIVGVVMKQIYFGVATANLHKVLHIYNHKTGVNMKANILMDGNVNVAKIECNILINRQNNFKI